MTYLTNTHTDRLANDLLHEQADKNLFDLFASQQTTKQADKQTNRHEQTVTHADTQTHMQTRNRQANRQRYG